VVIREFYEDELAVTRLLGIRGCIGAHCVSGACFS
jgi:hypothetical protein